ncbi:hypothetical protein, partial [Pseudomonas fluorescens]|uniref:hypothetical protein n=1 Tax=Pseudomonas fluorescens TaxID=294 RepID=UPI0038220CB7
MIREDRAFFCFGWGWIGGISVAAGVADYGSALTAIPFKVLGKIPRNLSQGSPEDVDRCSSSIRK